MGLPPATKERPENRAKPVEKKMKVNRITKMTLSALAAVCLSISLTGCTITGAILDDQVGEMTDQSGQQVWVYRDFWDRLYYLQDGAKVYVNSSPSADTENRATSWVGRTQSQEQQNNSQTFYNRTYQQPPQSGEVPGDAQTFYGQNYQDLLQSTGDPQSQGYNPYLHSLLLEAQ